MGSEINCALTQGKATFEGKAHLDVHQLTFCSPDHRLIIPLAEARSVTAVDGELRLNCSAGLVVLSLGPMAAKWADKILHPKSRLDKLGVKPGSLISFVSLEVPDFREEVLSRTPHLDKIGKALNCDLIFLGVQHESDLEEISRLIPRLKQNGGLWVVRPKGGKLTDVHVIKAGTAAGLVDVKVVSFSPTLSADKFVIPVAKRKPS